MVGTNLAGRVIAGLALAICGAEGVGQVRSPVPDKSAQAESEKLIRELFVEGFSDARSPTGRAAFGEILYRQALATEFDLAGRYVLFMLARDMYEEAGDVPAALRAVRETARRYQVEDLALEQAVLQRASIREGMDRAFLAEEALILMHRAVDRDNFAVATATGTLAGELGAAGERYQELLDHVELRRDAFVKTQGALKGLREDPEDPVLNLIVGEYRCFTQGRWDEGLPLLAKGSDELVKRIATADLANPQGQAQFLTARDWWELATNRPAEAREIRARAIYWYGQCQQILGGLDRARVVAILRAEADSVLSAATALATDGFPRLATFRLRRAVHLDETALEGAILALEDTIDAAGISDFEAPQLFAGRVEGSSKLAVRHKNAIAAGLEWLRLHQDDDGRWDTDGFMKHDREGLPSHGKGSAVHDVGVTGLALMAFLGEGNTTRDGLYADVVYKGVTWLRDQQRDRGRFGTNVAHDFIYDHVLATIAMCEAYGLAGDNRLRESAQAGIDYLEAHRNPSAVWRYQPRDNDNDSTVTGWCVVAYRSAQEVGLEVNPVALTNARSWYDELTSPSGEVGYQTPNEISSRHPGIHGSRFPPELGEALTAIGLSSRFLLGQSPKNTPVMSSAARTILAKPPLWNQATGTIDLYYWYHATCAMRQMGGNYWTTWSRRVAGELLDNQRHDGNFAGSWDSIGVWGDDGGRVYSTAMAILCLQGEYRYGDLLVAGGLRPHIPDGSRFNLLREAWQDESFPRIDRAHQRLQRADLTADERSVLENSEAMLAAEIDSAMKEISELRSGPDYATAYTRMEEIEEAFKGLSPADEADEVMREFMKDPSIRREITAEEQLQAVLRRFPLDSMRVRDRLIRELEDFAEKRAYRDTAAAKKAGDLLRRLGRGNS